MTEHQQHCDHHEVCTLNNSLMRSILPKDKTSFIWCEDIIRLLDGACPHDTRSRSHTNTSPAPARAERIRSSQCNRCISSGGGDCATCAPEQQPTPEDFEDLIGTNLEDNGISLEGERKLGKAYWDGYEKRKSEEKEHDAAIAAQEREKRIEFLTKIRNMVDDTKDLSDQYREKGISSCVQSELTDIINLIEGEIKSLRGAP